VPDFKQNYFQRRTKDRGPRSNNRISSPEVQVIASDGENLGVLNTNEAISMAKSQGLDLIEIAPNTNPPVCKIIELNKYLYSLKQKEKEQKKAARASQIETKEIRLGLNIDTGDLNTKAKHAQKFLEKGAKLTVTIVLRGRERGKQDMARELLNTFAEMIGIEYEQISAQGNRVMGRV